MAPTNDPHNALDHLILFLPADPAANLPKIPSFISDNFTLTPGGTHADGLTSNTLILLPDGCYIELISFLPSAPPAQVSTHWWSPFSTSPGWADWCLTNTLSPSENHALVQKTHQPPIHGGRKRADGVDVKWAVTFPKGENGGQESRGRLPFFCHDVTERGVRVPLNEEKTKHACGALGVRSLEVVVPDGEGMVATREGFAALLGEPVKEDVGHAEFGTERVVRVEELGGKHEGARVYLRLPEEGEKEKVEDRGFWYGNVVLEAKAREGKPAGTKERLDGSGSDLRGLWIVYT